MKLGKFIAGAAAGAAAAGLVRRKRKPKQRPARHARKRPVQPRDWAEARDILLERATSAAKRELRDRAIRAGLPIPPPGGKRRAPKTLYGAQAAAMMLPKRHDPYDDED